MSRSLLFCLVSFLIVGGGVAAAWWFPEGADGPVDPHAVLLAMNDDGEEHPGKQIPLECFDCHFASAPVSTPDCFSCHGQSEKPLGCFDCHGAHKKGQAPNFSNQQDCFECHN